ncbi:MAG: RNA-metabolising metallo-beta-lactamase [Candidatus Amesbacteria bacterium GW2011_GWA2_47_11b]|uniref:Ribonuclease J n=2 Tax=Candidatus Amesiibacteriota TaxID=1752730 RepID=A0A0G1SKL7_9BACT|nr:MAG: RNA-metabolising metallo-beta-lactamase [Microgenomates group bacterium GW2011_GWC1_46_20]KKU57922.1 MAG: RNA-metabolising metallo-beta-lactamase [Candidatus Amesbacteria bacterium GW2011_GWA2_47_11b]KKU70039.1 MAG: RNA-metabolising metallo-beta-lactamase [Candidatus Amesbacteria bacterium GW2011_GWA1_47_20]
MDNLRIISLGGFGKVTSNMFVYEYGDDILLVDCGIGFPTEDMLGVDLLIPDVSYLKNKHKSIRALVLTHGHEDHTGALPYILPQLKNVPVYASKLTAHLVMEKLAEYEGIPKLVNILVPGQPLTLGKFTVESTRISHSIPDATNLIIKTPVGTVYHGSDFKFDFSPVDSVLPDVGAIAAAGNSGVQLLLSDCLGSERKGYTPSEKTLEEMFEREINTCPGKFIVTTMGSNISRFRQAIDAAVRHGRRVAVLGRSIGRNLNVAQNLGYLKVPKGVFIDPKQARRFPPQNLCLLVAGSQGQTGSAMDRLSMGEHQDAAIKSGDKIVFSSDYIPGTESATQSLIDSLSKLGATVVYSNITDNLHVSGHGSQQDLLLMMALTRPKYLLPIGGTYRHMVQYSRLAQSMGYQASQILLPEFNQTIDMSPEDVKLGSVVEVKNVMVDGLGVGDVGHVVLRDRQVLAEEGVVVAVVQTKQNQLSQIENVDLISRGFVFNKENTNLLSEASAQVKQNVSRKAGHIDSERHLRELVADTLERFFFEKTGRRPMILPVVVEV